MSMRNLMLGTGAMMAITGLMNAPHAYAEPRRDKPAPPQEPTQKRAKVKAARKQRIKK